MEPFFSIIISAFNAEKLLSRAIESVLNQNYSDVEIIIVDDKSTDNTLAVAKKYAKDNHSIHILKQHKNTERHRTHMRGIQAARGKWILFLDSDDELLPNTLSKLTPVLNETKSEIIHFGLEVIGENVPKWDVDNIENQAKRDFGTVSGVDLLRLPYDEEYGYAQDFRMTHHAYSAPLLKKASGKMVDWELGCGEDSYEYFITASLANSLETHNEIVGYRYYLGAGGTGTSAMTLSAFYKLANQYDLVLKALDKYISEEDPHNVQWKKSAQGIKNMLYNFLIHDAFGRLTCEETQEVIDFLLETQDAPKIANEVMREVRDAAYEKLSTGKSKYSFEELSSYFCKATKILQDANALEIKKNYAFSAALHLWDLLSSTLDKDTAFLEQQHLLENSQSQALASIVLNKIDDACFGVLAAEANPLLLEKLERLFLIAQRNLAGFESKRMKLTILHLWELKDKCYPHNKALEMHVNDLNTYPSQLFAKCMLIIIDNEAYKILHNEDSDYSLDDLKLLFKTAEKVLRGISKEEQETTLMHLWDLVDMSLAHNEALQTHLKDIAASQNTLLANCAVKRVDDIAYKSLTGNSIEYTTDELQTILDAVKESGYIIDQTLFERAQFHLNRLNDLNAFLTSPTPVELYVSAQKPVDTFNTECIRLVEAGASLAKHNGAFDYQDNNGKHISKLNPFLCEITTQYWACNNSKASYIGFMHYRRYFNFSSYKYEENEYGEIIDTYIDEKTQKKYGITDAAISRICSEYDIITSEIKDISTFPEHFSSIWDHYNKAPHLFSEDLDACMEIAETLYPDYAEDIETYLSGTKTAFCNMYIMSATLMKEYNDWLFSIIDVYLKEWDKSYYSHQGLRTPGHLAERLWNIWMNHKVRNNPELKVKQLQVVNFRQPDALSPLTVPSPEVAENKQVIPIVFAADDAYTAMVGVTIYSLLKNASQKYFYDIFIFETRISEENKERLRATIHPFKNVRLTFVDAGKRVQNYELSTHNPHISNETYYRFLVQEELPFYDKVIYLDSDLLVVSDISELFNIELNDTLLAATRDIDYLGNINMPDGNRWHYSKEILQMEDPYSYFQAGVLLLNTKKLRKRHTTAEWLEIASSHPEFIYNDQDILNAECEGNILYLDQTWNIMNNAYNRVETVFSFAPAEVFDTYIEAAKHPKIIHYAGGEKPWFEGHCADRDEYFAYAKETPFYEDLVAQYGKIRNFPNPEMPEIPAPQIIHVPIEQPRNLWSRFIDKTLPKESFRRRAITKVYRTIRK